MNDPKFLRTRKEALLIMLSWIVFMIWTVGVSWILGYTGDAVTLILGFPTWVLVGVMIPWLVGTAFSVWFSLSYMRDE